MPLSSLALGFARFATGIGLARARADAARRIYQAAVAEPFYVAGTGRICTDLMTALKGAALIKTGAEGVFCAALAGARARRRAEDRRRRDPRRGGDDGGGHRAAPAGARGDARRWTNAPVVTRRGAKVGEVRALRAAFQALGA